MCTISKKQHVVMRAKFTTFTFSESVGNEQRLFSIQKLFRFLYSDATCNVF